jgi:23S rRNA (adenine-N6)-dimethyltransferase
VSVRRPSAGGPRAQHFLRSSRLAETIVREAGVLPGQLVLDLGAGRGALTAPLARAGARVIAVERDPALASELRSRFPAVRVVEADAARWRWPDEPFAVVANLPFAGAASILRSLLDEPAVPLRRADVIVQWEFAAKQAAVWPSTLRSVLWGAWWELSITRRLAPSAFAPPPSVFAALLSIRRLHPPLLDPAESQGYATFLRRMWGDAPLRNVLAPTGLKRLALENGFDRGARARDLDARQWAAVFRGVSFGSGSPGAPGRSHGARPTERASRAGRRRGDGRSAASG